MLLVAILLRDCGLGVLTSARIFTAQGFLEENIGQFSLLKLENKTRVHDRNTLRSTSVHALRHILMPRNLFDTLSPSRIVEQRDKGVFLIGENLTI